MDGAGSCVSIILAAICAIADAVNYDTSWGYVYEGGTTKAGKSTFDSFRDAKPLASGGILCVGGTQDSADQGAVLAVRLSSDGKPNRTRLYSFPKGALGASLVIGKSGNPIIGGNRYIAPLLLRLDTALEPVSAAWHYDSIPGKDRLSMGATLNSLLELDDGRIVTGNNNNGFVIRVVPKPVPLGTALFRSPAAAKPRWAGGAFAFETPRPCDIVLGVTDFQGRSVSRRSFKAAAGRNTITVPEARSRGGLLLWRMTLAGGALSGKQVF